MQQAARSLSGRGDMTHAHDTLESRAWPFIRAGELGSASRGCLPPRTDAGAGVVREDGVVWAPGGSGEAACI